ncbi:tRNA-queuosine alpha-mannosyltransferase domain-containing protein [Neorhodopirellula lusitana]|uniref:tRNA-queuosine alpha-mannosyltransferase domain-containing protein n=1 Tax=Neorhodopirellula lusitana TaxID=445327 RepID=UPI00384B4E4A
MHILAVEPYYGGSHRSFLDNVVQRSRHDWTLVTGPARHWKWRMRSSSLALAEQATERLRSRAENEAPEIDLVFCTDMLDVPQWLGLMHCSPLIAPNPTKASPNSLLATNTPVVTYFHENQWTYPTAPRAREDFHYGYTNLLTALASDAIWFNSRFHQDTFWDASQNFLRRMPDSVPAHRIDAAIERSLVVPPGFNGASELADARPHRSAGTDSPLVIGWVSRWEPDKRPDQFARILESLHQQGVPFELILLGARPQKTPPELEVIRERYREQVRHDGFAGDDYHERLAEMDVVVSTADHEFFGIAVCEAIWAGAIPVVPNRLSYPELVPSTSQYDSRNEAVQLIAKIARQDSKTRDDRWRQCRDQIADFRTSHLVPIMDDLLDNVLVPNQ